MPLTGATPAAGTAPPVVEVVGADIGYGDLRVVRDLDLTVRAGEVCAILGPNGCGKSTLVKGILGLARVFEGDVRLFGRPPDRLGRADIGYVPQRVHVSTGLPVTVLETVSAGRLPRMRRLRPMTAADRSAVRAALDRVGLADRARSRMAELSGGQQRRALLARALSGDPRVLVLDEPLAGVDLRHQALLADALAGLVAEGRTVLVVLHELGPLAPHIGRVLAMRDGQVRYDGPVRAVDVHLHGSEDHLHDAAPSAGPLPMPSPLGEG